MSTKDVRLQWDDKNMIEKGHKIYRSDSPMDINNLPTPIATLEPNTTEYVDTARTIGNTYYYRVSAYINGSEMVSEEVPLKVTELSYSYISTNYNEVNKIDSDGTRVWSFNGFSENNIYTLDVDFDGYVYAGSSDDTLRKIDPNGNEVWVFNGYGGNISSIAVDPSGYVYTGLRDSTVRKIDPDGNELWSFNGHTNTPTSIAATNEFIITTSYDNTVRKIDSNGNQVWVYNGISSNPVDVVLDDDLNIYVASYDNNVKKLNGDGEELLIFSHAKSVFAVDVDARGNVYTGGLEKIVRKFDSNGNQLWKYDQNSVSISGISVDSDGNVHFTLGYPENSLKKLDTNGNEIFVYYGNDSSYQYAGMQDVVTTKIPIPLSAGSLDGTGYNLKKITIE